MRALETERKRNNEWLRKNAKRNGRTYRTYEEYRVYVPDRYTTMIKKTQGQTRFPPCL